MEKEKLVSVLLEGSKVGMLRKKTKYTALMKNFSSRKSAYKQGWSDCLVWVIEKLNSEQNVQGCDTTGLNQGDADDKQKIDDNIKNKTDERVI